MTDIDKKIAELGELMTKATPGPWVNHDGHEDYHYGAIGKGEKHIAMCNFFNARDEEQRVTRDEQAANAALIVAMRNALPKLIAEIKRLKGALNIETAGHDNTADELTHVERERDAALARAEKAETERDVLARLCSNLKIDDGVYTDRWCPKEQSGTCMRCYIVDPGEDEWCEQGCDDINCWLGWAAQEVAKRMQEEK